MSKEKRNKIIQLVIAIISFGIAILLDYFLTLSIEKRALLYLIPYVVAAYDVYIEAFMGIKNGEIFDEHFLLCVASIGALCIGFLPNSEPEFLEAVFVLIFFQVGELFEIIAEDDSEKSINALLEIRPDYANLEGDDKKVKKVSPDKVKVFDIIVVNPGEKIPMDGEIIEGKSSLNTVALTGESAPLSVDVGDYVMSGCININGSIRIKVMKLFEESTASKIIDMVENSTENKASSDKFITKFARVYTPLVVLLALLIFLIPPLFLGNYALWLKRSLTFLIVSCPCALVISVPLSYFGGVGCASKRGILIKGAYYLEKLSKVSTIAFDKTGTLTKGTFEVVAIHPEEYNEKELLHLAAHVEKNSNHPIANSLKEAYDKYDNLNDSCKIKDIEELPGLGIKAKVNKDIIYVGNKKLMDSINIKIKNCKHYETVVHIAKKDSYLGHIVISDIIKEDTKKTIETLKSKNIKTVMLTGDTKDIAKEVAKDVGIDEYYYELMPKDKVKKLTELKQDDSCVAFVGDGINDAPVLSRSDLGISMGGLGSDAAIEASNVVIMDDNISKIIDAINISKKTELIAKENISFTLVVKLCVMVAAFFGYAPMALAIFADVGVTIIAILNSLRTLRDKK